MIRSRQKTDPQVEAALKRLDTIVGRAPDLSESVAFYRAALPVLREAQDGVSPLPMDRVTAQRKLSAGVPLLVDEDLPLDLNAIQILLLKLCRAAEDAGVSAAQVRRAVERHELDIFALMSALAAGDWPSMEPKAAALGLHADLLKLLVQNALKPSFRVWACSLRDVVPVDNWRRGECPVCGSPPALAEIRGKEGARFHRCAMCGAGWPYPRLQCAFCGNHDHRSLGVIHAEGEEEKYRVQVCDDCRGYLKFVVTFDPIPVDQLVAEDLATLHLDLIAAEREFTHSPA